MQRHATFAAAVLALVLLGYTIVIGIDDTLRYLRGTQTVWSHASDDERVRAYGSAVPLDMEIFDFYRRFLRPGDRYYMQVRRDAFSAFADKRTVVTRVWNLYLLPAVQVDSPGEADVVLSWESDPATLGLPYSDQVRAGLQLIFASRVRRDA